MLSFGAMAPASLKPAYLLCGSDRPKVRLAVARLRARVVEEAGSDINTTLFDAEADTPEVVLEAASTPGFALGTRLLLVLNAHKWKVKQRQAIVAYFADPMPDTCLAIEGETFAKDDALAKAIARTGEVLRYDLPKKYELVGWTTKMARARGLTLPPAVARHLLGVCGEDPQRLEREIDKLATYCRGAEATVADVDDVCSPDDSVRIFELMDAIGDRDRGKAFRMLEIMFADGDPRNDANSVLASLKRHIVLLEGALELGQSDQASAAKALGVHPFTAKKLLVQRDRYDRRKIATAYKALAEAEVGMRGRPPASLESSGGVNHGDRLVIELALARMLK